MADFKIMSDNDQIKKLKTKKPKPSPTSTDIGDTNPSSTSATSGAKRQNDSQGDSTKKFRQSTSIFCIC